MAYYNLARMYTYSTGDSDIVLDSAVPGCKTFASVGVSDSYEVTYGMITYNLTTHRPVGSEAGTGKYIVSGTVFKRTTIENSTDSDDSAINLTGLSEIFLCPIASNFDNFGGGAGVPFAGYRNESTGNTLTNNTDDNLLTIDTERIDADGLATLSSNIVTLAGAGWYRVHLAVYITAGGSSMNGRVKLMLSTTPSSPINYKGYTTAMAINDDMFYIDELFQFSANDTLRAKMDNHSGFSIDAYVLDLSFEKLA